MTNIKHKNFNFSLFQASNLICFIAGIIKIKDKGVKTKDEVQRQKIKVQR